VLLTGAYTISDVHEFLDRSGYRVRANGKSAARNISRSALYRLFDNRFYSGYFRHRGELIKDSHIPMISEAEFRRVQLILGKATYVKREVHRHAYSGMIRCGSCSCQVCGEKHFRQVVGGVNVHTYYACSNGKRICNKRLTTEEQLEDHIITNVYE
jgi:site-specific DNA recombinase